MCSHHQLPIPGPTPQSRTQLDMLRDVFHECRLAGPSLSVDPETATFICEPAQQTGMRRVVSRLEDPTKGAIMGVFDSSLSKALFSKVQSILDAITGFEPEPCQGSSLGCSVRSLCGCNRFGRGIMRVRGSSVTTEQSLNLCFTDEEGELVYVDTAIEVVVAQVGAPISTDTYCTAIFLDEVLHLAYSFDAKDGKMFMTSPLLGA